ncbi:MAG TPA: hypothetical protein VF487_12395 [Chitinophagaceae bacterium]
MPETLHKNRSGISYLKYPFWCIFYITKNKVYHSKEWIRSVIDILINDREAVVHVVALVFLCLHRSVNKLDLKPDDLTKLKTANPGKSIIGIFQSTKDGKFRGTNTFQHDVDVVIEIPEKG